MAAIVVVCIVYGGMAYSKGGNDVSPSSAAVQYDRYNASHVGSLYDASGNAHVHLISRATQKKSKSKPAHASVACGSDPWTSTGSSNGSGKNLQVRPNHPLLIAPGYQWSCLSKRIAADSYLTKWDKQIMSDAQTYYNDALIVYVYDGGPSGSGVLDIARRVQQRVKVWAYAYQRTGDSKWATRAWKELYAMTGEAPGASATKVGKKGDTWNSAHFLDTAEFTFAFALAYDQMYDAWTSTQLSQFRGWIVNLGLKKGLSQISNNNFWLTATGNWNCVCNNGLTAGALAIYNEDTTGVAKQILSKTIPNALDNCAQAIATDGTWLETADYCACRSLEVTHVHRVLWHHLSRRSHLESDQRDRLGSRHALGQLGPQDKRSLPHARHRQRPEGA